MISDEVVYSFILLFTIAVGLPLRKLNSYIWKQVVTGGIGCFIVFAVCQGDGLYSLITILVNIAIIKLGSRNVPLLSFSWCFLFLLCFRCATFFGLPKPTPLANAVQLLLTLKLVSVAIEVHDFRQKNSKTSAGDKVTTTRFQLELTHEPTSFAILCYSYCYTGLFTGPMFKYRTYHDYLMMNPKVAEKIEWKEELISRMKQVALYAVLYLAASYFFTIQYPKSDQFYDEPLWYRVFYMVPIFFIGRMRFYTAWLLAECSFVTLTLGAYPKDSLPRPGNGPTVDPKAKPKMNSDDDTEYTYDTVRNIDPAGCEWSPTVRLGMRNWNMTVQWWLANFVHKRWPNSMKKFKVPAVMAVSAYWHGIDPGFFGAFLTMPFVMMTEDLFASLIKRRLPDSMHGAYDWLNWFAKMRAFEYMYMAFALLSWRDTYRYWKSVYFWLHIVAFVLIALGMTAKSFVKKPRKSTTSDQAVKEEKRE